MRSVFQWSLAKRTLELGKRTLIMGIVNVTPDSFSDGGLYLDSEKAIAHIHMPMSIDAVLPMQARARIGATHWAEVGGFSAESGLIRRRCRVLK